VKRLRDSISSKSLPGLVGLSPKYFQKSESRANHMNIDLDSYAPLQLPGDRRPNDGQSFIASALFYLF
jgi:hypothetical protein